MGLKDDMAKDFIDNFLADNEFAEEVVYTPKNDSAKTIMAVIERKPTDAIQLDRRHLVHQEAQIYIANDDEQGVTVITEKSDTVSFPVEEGGDAVDWSVVEILNHDSGMWHLRVTLA